MGTLTNYEFIKEMSVDDMAAFLYSIVHERDLRFLKMLSNKGISASLVETNPEVQIALHKRWLESEVEAKCEMD